MGKILPQPKRGLQVELGILITEMLEELAKVEGTDPTTLIMLQVSKLFNNKWDFRNGWPKEFGGRK